MKPFMWKWYVTLLVVSNCTCTQILRQHFWLLPAKVDVDVSDYHGTVDRTLCHIPSVCLLCVAQTQDAKHANAITTKQSHNICTSVSAGLIIMTDAVMFSSGLWLLFVMMCVSSSCPCWRFFSFCYFTGDSREGLGHHHFGEPCVGLRPTLRPGGLPRRVSVWSQKH